MKKTMSLILALLLCAGLAAPVLAAGPSETSVTVGGDVVQWTDARPFIDANNRTMVPLRAVADAMGLQVSWHAADREAVFTDGSKVIYFPIGSSAARTGDGGSVQMDTTAVIANDRTYAPIRYLAEYFGYEVGWDEATRTVSLAMGNREDFVCGETEPHDWKEANYQAPETCAVCGETRGSALTPDFVTYGIKTDMVVGAHYDYETVCYDDTSVKTVGEVTVLDYSIFDSDATHAAKAGYEWRVATFQILYGDENANVYGYSTSSSREDYYDIRLNDDTVVYDDNGNATFTVNYYGENRECSYFSESLVNEWQEGGYAYVGTVVFRVSYQVPVGYDGCVYGVRDGATEWPEDGYVYDIYDPDAFHYFRFS